MSRIAIQVFSRKNIEKLSNIVAQKLPNFLGKKKIVKTSEEKPTYEIKSFGKEDKTVTFSAERTKNTQWFSLGLFVALALIAFELIFPGSIGFLVWSLGLNYIWENIFIVGLIIIAVGLFLYLLATFALSILQRFFNSSGAWVLDGITIVFILSSIYLLFPVANFFKDSFVIYAIAPIILGFGLGVGVLSHLPPGFNLFVAACTFFGVAVDQVSGIDLINLIADRIVLFVSKNINDKLVGCAKLQLEDINIGIFVFFISLAIFSIPFLKEQKVD